MGKTIRKSNFELLRILLMYGIVLSHFASHGVWDGADSSNRTTVTLLMGLGPIGVDAFIILTGYFGVHKRFSLTNIMKVLVPTGFWMLFFNALTLFLPFAQPTISQRLEIPWFIIGYCSLQVFVPWLNMLCSNTRRESLLCFLTFGFAFLSFITITTGTSFFYSNLSWFCLLYIVGGYISLHLPRLTIRRAGTLLVLSVLIHCFFFAVTNSILGRGFPFSPQSLTYRNTPSIFAIAVCVFLLFREIDLGYNKTINQLASYTLGVYIISDNAIVRNAIWTPLSKLGSLEYFAFVVSGCICALFVYLLCTMLEAIRTKVNAHSFLPDGLGGEFLALDNRYADLVDAACDGRQGGLSDANE